MLEQRFKYDFKNGNTIIINIERSLVQRDITTNIQIQKLVSNLRKSKVNIYSKV